ncbi:MAG: FAD-binding oxidoreductase [Rubellimicrobium sp.]|nr:FAD-binding oxidoreductase [Rubellimicrobium sp.]
MLNPASADFIESLRALLPPAAFPELTEAELTEPRGRWHGQGVLVAPGATDEVAALLRACSAARVGVVPRSGGTGLVSGQVMPEGPLPVILSLARMDRLRDLRADERVIVVEAGVTLAAVQAAARDAGGMFPLSLASEGSARVGGVLATNAGGTHVLRYGNARALCLGIEAVTADGRVWHGLTRLRKDNAGYDLRDLVVGSEGTLAIITAAALRMVPAPAHEGAALLAVPSPAAALELLSLAHDVAGDQVSGFELIARQGLEFLDEGGIPHPDPLRPRPEWMVLLDLGLSGDTAPEDLITRIWERGEARGLVNDGVIAASEAQRAAFWHLRESIPEGNRRVGSVSSHDISLPLSEIAGFIERGRAAVAALGPFRINCFGHLGDGNLHYNVFPPRGAKAPDYGALRARVQEVVHDLVHEAGGSFAAEHGVGRLKVGDLERYGDPVMLSLMRGVKAAFDPQGILNPGAMLRS